MHACYKATIAARKNDCFIHACWDSKKVNIKSSVFEMFQISVA